MGTAVTAIRRMTRSDLPVIVEMESRLQPRPWSEGVLTDEIERSDRRYLVAEEGVVCGYAGVMVVGDEAHVTNILVEPDYRRRGIARRLMEALRQEAIDAGARHMTLEVRLSNDAARSLYSSLGMAPVGIRPRYYGDEDALIFWAHDIDNERQVG